MVCGSQALEKVWLFSVPLHPMLILSKHICGISETSGRKICQQYHNMSAVHLCTI